MNNILNAQEAFAALQKGKTVLCRYAGDGVLHADKDFNTLDQMPATVFGLPNYEFCIQLEMLELAGIKFTKPLTVDEYQEGQDVFVICTYAPSIYVMNFKTSALVESINSGFVQRDAENAELQLKAISKALGREFNNDVTVTRLGKEPSKIKRKKEPQENITTADAQKEKVKQIEHNKDLVIDAIATCLTAEEVETTCYGLDGNGFNEAQLEAITGAKLAKLEQLAQEKVAAESEDHELFIQDKSEPELSVLCEAFIGEIMEATTPAKLNVIHGRINTSTGLEEYEHEILAKELELKLTSFSTQQAPVDINVVAAAAVAQAQNIDVETVQKNNERKPIEEEEEKYQSKLIELKKRVDESTTPDEVNTVIKSTNSWSADQRQPLLQYMHKRLEVLQNEKADKQPSLMAQIQNAPDLTALDALEIDVSAMDPIAQPEMMRYVSSRRAELEQSASTSIDEDLP
ncbi:MULTISPECIES: hypothetical protein [Acinetobacter]|uniref:Uncharacterized protein n=1 Tax=Acinetobacter higginsii TaxID=70347 RepID=N8XPG0_9GAMM|nr:MULTISPECIES: hypothetical protein [Acinetobacter]ENV08945.1 hypothetical protein F966_02590 [Acinetobacter higginsii]NNP70838.1 hypothetical protein [Acinetobacter sp. Ac_5812]